jgi:hypothetical protein
MQYNIDVYGNEKEFDNTNFTVLQQILKWASAFLFS